MKDLNKTQAEFIENKETTLQNIARLQIVTGMFQMYLREYTELHSKLGVELADPIVSLAEYLNQTKTK